MLFNAGLSRGSQKRGFKIATEPYTMLLNGIFPGSLLFMGFFSIGLQDFTLQVSKVLCIAFDVL